MTTVVQFPSVHAALSFAWRLETVSPQQSQLFALRGAVRSKARSDMTPLEWAGQAAVIRKTAEQRLSPDLLAWVVARYSAKDAAVEIALAVVAARVRVLLNHDDEQRSPLLNDIVRGVLLHSAGAPNNRGKTQRALAHVHDCGQSTVSRLSARVQRELSRIRMEVDDAMHGELARRGLIDGD